MLMDSMVYQHRVSLTVDTLRDGWAKVRSPDDPVGVALDLTLSAIWSAANNRSAEEVARTAGVSTYLTACALAVLQRAELLQTDASTGSPFSPDWNPPSVRPSISVVIVHHDVQAALKGCVTQLLGQDYPALTEIVILTTMPIELDEEPIHQILCDGASLVGTLVDRLNHATGEAILLLDSQVCLAPGSLAEMAHAWGLCDDIAAVAPRVMWSKRPGFVTHMGDWRKASDVRLNPYAGQLDVGQFKERWQTAPAFNLAAGLVDRAALSDIGEPDSKYSLDWLGVDWCYRARRHGYHILAASQAVAYSPWPERADLAQETQDKLRFVTRNLDPVSARRQINLYRQQDKLCPQAEQEARHRGWKAFQASEVTPRGVDRAPHNDERLDALVPPGPGAMVHEGAPALTVENVRGVYSHHPAVAPLPIRQRIAFIGQETLRHRAMTRALGEWCEVNWVVPHAGDGLALRRLCEAADLVITTAEELQRFPFLRNGHRPIMVATQPPLIPGAHIKGAHKGALHKQAETCPELAPRWLDNVDLLICASEEERLYWLGQLAARGRVNRYTWQNDPALRNLVTVVPSAFETPMPPSEPVLKGIHPDIHAGDQVILWCGGLQSSDDPLTAIRALAKLQPACGDAKLVFAALNDQPWDEELLASAGQLAAELDLEHAVLFVEGVPPHLRAGYLAEADLGIALSMNTLEAQLSQPVGLAACMAAGRPLVATLGRAGSSLVARYELGYCVPAGDIAAVAEAMNRSLKTPRALYRDRFARASAALAPSKSIAPLIRFCRRQQLALDRRVKVLLHSKLVPSAPQPTPLGELPIKFWHTLRHQGLRSTSQEVLQYIRWKMRR